MSPTALATATRPQTINRDGEWLRGELERIWVQYFADTPRANRIDITFRRPWMRRLGVIRLSEDERTTVIGINSLLRLPEVPYCLTLITVAHELVHYAHGFGSPLARRFEHPHKGGIVTRELKHRGLQSELDEYSDWIAEHWWAFYARQQRSSG